MTSASTERKTYLLGGSERGGSDDVGSLGLLVLLERSEALLLHTGLVEDVGSLEDGVEISSLRDADTCKTPKRLDNSSCRSPPERGRALGFHFRDDLSGHGQVGRRDEVDLDAGEEREHHRERVNSPVARIL